MTDAAAGLGPDSDLLRLLEGALEAPENRQAGRVALRRRSPPHQRRKALHEGGQRHRPELEAPQGRRAGIPSPRPPIAPPRGRSRCMLTQWSQSRGPGSAIPEPRGRRLNPVTHLLTGPHESASIVSAGLALSNRTQTGIDSEPSRKRLGDLRVSGCVRMPVVKNVVAGFAQSWSVVRQRDNPNTCTGCLPL